MPENRGYLAGDFFDDARRSFENGVSIFREEAFEDAFGEDPEKHEKRGRAERKASMIWLDMPGEVEQIAWKEAKAHGGDLFLKASLFGTLCAGLICNMAQPEKTEELSVRIWGDKGPAIVSWIRKAWPHRLMICAGRKQAFQETRPDSLMGELREAGLRMRMLESLVRQSFMLCARNILGEGEFSQGRILCERTCAKGEKFADELRYTARSGGACVLSIRQETGRAILSAFLENGMGCSVDASGMLDDAWGMEQALRAGLKSDA